MGRLRNLLRATGLSIVAVSTMAMGNLGCEGGLPGEPGEPPSATEPNPVPPQVDPTLSAALAQGGAVEAVVAIDDSALRASYGADRFGSLAEGADMASFARGLDAVKDRVLGRLAGQRLTAVNRYPHLPLVHMRIESAEALAALAADPEVTRIAPDVRYALMDTVPVNLSQIGQPAAAAAGKLGAGATVAVLDTGADYTRAPFSCTKPGGNCPVVYAADFATEDNTTDDAHGHGTNVSGVVLSVAPAAKIAALDVFAGDTAPSTAILAAVNWAIDNRAKYNIVALNMSFGSGSFTSTCATDFLAVAVDQARAAGILSAVAAGNDAKSNALSSPACGTSAVSVGAVYSQNLGSLRANCVDATTAADQVACFSNSASFLTMLAPGVMITAAGITMSGTSQATPHVAGAIAVLRAAFPNESPTAIVTRLTASGVGIKDARNGLSKPRLALAAALAYTAPVVTPEPAPTPAPAPKPVPGPTGTLVINAGAKYTRSATVTASVPVTSSKAADVCLGTEATCTAWVKWAPTVSFTISGADGLKTIRALWRDAAGNVSAKAVTTTITLDTHAPVGGTLTVKAATTLVTYGWTGISDAGSGVASYKLVTSTTGPLPAGCGSGQVLASSKMVAAVQMVNRGVVTYFRLCATDTAGNTSDGLAGQFTVPALVATATKR